MVSRAHVPLRGTAASSPSPGKLVWQVQPPVAAKTRAPRSAFAGSGCATPLSVPDSARTGRAKAVAQTHTAAQLQGPLRPRARRDGVPAEPTDPGFRLRDRWHSRITGSDRTLPWACGSCRGSRCTTRPTPSSPPRSSPRHRPPPPSPTHERPLRTRRCPSRNASSPARSPASRPSDPSLRSLRKAGATRLAASAIWLA